MQKSTTHNFDVEQCNLSEPNILLRFSKYMLIGIVVIFAALYLIDSSSMKIRDIIILGMVASITFAIIDILVPSQKCTINIKKE